ncbi:MAG: MBL fold metallo-hydrolase, partial [Myxococcaceae bacterium]|nr:MBL fold metallo-hydrolase [Myxococcaceae bacterium]MCI0672413.1 MBL fold metallo-hydrolase [Myxococcaceae bacterium]
MHITYLGHAGFLVETAEAVVVTDPWLSAEGAFDSSWMQLPRNHHLADHVRSRLADGSKERYVFVSHEHRDHFDPGFLASLTDKRNVTLVLGRFQRRALQRHLEALGFEQIAVLGDGERLPISGGSLRLFITDSGLNRDSALLVKSGGRSFLDLNDCKIHDRLPRIVSEEGAIDVFTAQFSGAIWHPTCYEYDRATYEEVSRKKQMSKFEAVSRAVEAVQPRAFIASAGPVCFLDPDLLHLNFEKVNIFPRAPVFFDYLGRRLKGAAPRLLNLMPGDRVDAVTVEVEELGTERFTEETFEPYVKAYARDMEGLFRARRRNLMREEVDLLFGRLRKELEEKLARLTLADRVGVPLYVGLSERPGEWMRVDFRAQTVEVVREVREEPRYVFTVAAGNVARVLDRKMTWEDFMLSFRLRLSRTPDTYDAILHGFLAGEVEDLVAFCDTVREAEARKDERIVVKVGDQHFSVRRFCPHQGADLTHAWVEEGRYLVCPRHRWQFDMSACGACTANDTSIDAQPCEAPRSKPSSDEQVVPVAPV